ncbi:MAG: uncharacterized membrane protein YsdA (DUF1294 family) [Colwellia sp.]|jgi:uncharacterized membrane protein YsdA (DUF1294 family)
MFSKIIAILFLLVITFLFFNKGLHRLILFGYFTLSLLTFVLYAIDKRNAIKGRRRISEKTLQISALLGGWPGALLAQQTFRHKTQKRPFILVLWLGILINIGVFAYFLYSVVFGL